MGPQKGASPGAGAGDMDPYYFHDGRHGAEVVRRQASKCYRGAPMGCRMDVRVRSHALWGLDQEELDPAGCRGEDQAVEGLATVGLDGCQGWLEGLQEAL